MLCCRIRSDHNEDNTAEILSTWVTEWARFYHAVDLIIRPSPPYYLYEETGPVHWPHSRYSHLISMKEQALNTARNLWADYIWVRQ